MLLLQDEGNNLKKKQMFSITDLATPCQLNDSALHTHKKAEQDKVPGETPPEMREGGLRDIH